MRKDISGFENYDLWACFLEEVWQRGDDHGTVFRVAAHLSPSNLAQDPSLTRGHAQSDARARELALKKFHSKLEALRAYISRACDLQTHVALMSREEQFSCGFHNEWCEPSRARKLTTSCACPPKFRIRSKSQISCGLNCCNLRAPAAEERFMLSVASKSRIPDAVYAKVWGMHPRLKTALRCIGTRSPNLVPQLGVPQSSLCCRISGVGARNGQLNSAYSLL